MAPGRGWRCASPLGRKENTACFLYLHLATPNLGLEPTASQSQAKSRSRGPTSLLGSGERITKVYSTRAASKRASSVSLDYRTTDFRLPSQAESENRNPVSEMKKPQANAYGFFMAPGRGFEPPT